MSQTANADTEDDDQQTRWERFTEGMGQLPWCGGLLQYLLEQWGLRSTLFFMAGFVICGMLVYWGHAPAFLTARYARVTTPTLISPPQSLTLRKIKALPQWLQPYQQSLENEADARLAADSIKGHLVGGLETAPWTGSTTEPFSFTVQVSANYQLSAWVFRLDKTGTLKVLPIDNVSPTALKGQIDRYANQDRIVVIATVTSSSIDPSGKLEDFVQLKVE